MLCFVSGGPATCPSLKAVVLAESCTGADVAQEVKLFYGSGCHNIPMGLYSAVGTRSLTSTLRICSPYALQWDSGGFETPVSAAKRGQLLLPPCWDSGR